MLTVGCVSRVRPSCMYLSLIRLHVGVERRLIKVDKSDTAIQQVKSDACRGSSPLRSPRVCLPLNTLSWLQLCTLSHLLTYPLTLVSATRKRTQRNVKIPLLVLSLWQKRLQRSGLYAAAAVLVHFRAVHSVTCMQAGLQDQCDVCTFRNNLNKIFATPLNLQSPWVVDACMLGQTMHLDIHKLPETVFPNSELFQYYGYR